MAYPQLDPILATMLDVMAEQGFVIDITLTLPGLVIGGTPISEKEYYERQGALLGDAIDRSGQEGEAFRRVYTDLGAQADKGMRDRIQSGRQARQSEPHADQSPPDDPDRFVRKYVYLKDAVVLGAGYQALNLPVWQGRLTEVVGWCYGRPSVG
jgi:hypothetical protein